MHRRAILFIALLIAAAAAALFCGCILGRLPTEPADQPTPFEPWTPPRPALELRVFTRPGCPPCETLKADMMAAPIRDAIADYRVQVIDTTQNADKASLYAIDGTPTSIKTIDGREIDRKVGYRDPADYAAWLADGPRPRDEAATAP